MAARRKPGPAPTPPQSEAQRKRAAELRRLIRDLASGKRPAGEGAPTPREITDEAARRKYEAERKKRGR